MSIIDVADRLLPAMDETISERFTEVARRRFDVHVGHDTHDDGRIAVDTYLRTGADGVLAPGDVSSPVRLKHAADHEAQVVQHDLLNPDRMREVDPDLVPAAVFTSPQVGTVGLTEQRAATRAASTGDAWPTCSTGSTRP